MRLVIYTSANKRNEQQTTLLEPTHVTKAKATKNKLILSGTSYFFFKNVSFIVAEIQ